MATIQTDSQAALEAIEGIGNIIQHLDSTQRSIASYQGCFGQRSQRFEGRYCWIWTCSGCLLAASSTIGSNPPSPPRTGPNPGDSEGTCRTCGSSLP